MKLDELKELLNEIEGNPEIEITLPDGTKCSIKDIGVYGGDLEPQILDIGLDL